MSSDPFYKSAAWRRLCKAVKRRSRGQCEAPGCTSPGKIVDHIISRRRGGPDHESNLRHLCPRHDNEIKEDQHGNRRGDGKLKSVPACDASGLPLDQSHPFYGEAGSNITAQRGQGPGGARIRSKFGRR